MSTSPAGTAALRPDRLTRSRSWCGSAQHARPRKLLHVPAGRVSTYLPVLGNLGWRLVWELASTLAGGSWGGSGPLRSWVGAGQPRVCRWAGQSFCAGGQRRAAATPPPPAPSRALGVVRLFVRPADQFWGKRAFTDDGIDLQLGGRAVLV